MWKRRLILPGSLLLLMALSLAIPLPGRTKTPIEARYDRVRFGMTADEVTAIMDLPVYRHGGIKWWQQDYWDEEGQDAAVKIEFTNGRVSGKELNGQPALWWLESARG